VRAQARALGIAQVSDLIAVTDGGNGLEEALQHLAENLTTILDWYHAAEHICDFAKVWHAHDDEARTQWQQEAKSILYEQGGEALLAYLGAIELPSRASADFWSRWYLRAVFSSMSVLAAAAASVLPPASNRHSFRTCLSVTTASLHA
jgi:hypothetical protein